MSDSDAHATLNIDLSGVAGTWCLAYLCLPEDVRDEARRATALNFLIDAEGKLHPQWEATFPKVLAFLREGPAVSNVASFKPKVIEDGTG